MNCQLFGFFFSSIFLSDRGAAARQNSHVRVFFHAAAMGFFTEVVEMTPPGPMDHLQYSRRNPKKRCGRNLNFWSAPTTPKPAIHGAIASGPFSKLDYSASETRSMPNNNAFWKKKKKGCRWKDRSRRQLSDNAFVGVGIVLGAEGPSVENRRRGCVILCHIWYVIGKWLWP